MTKAVLVPGSSARERGTVTVDASASQPPASIGPRQATVAIPVVVGAA